jgi:hypothetical protein
LSTERLKVDDLVRYKLNVAGPDFSCKLNSEESRFLGTRVNRNSSETSVRTRSTRRHIPEDGILQSAATRSRWFLILGFFYYEDGGDTFLRNVGSHKIYTAPHLTDGILYSYFHKNFKSYKA